MKVNNDWQVWFSGDQAVQLVLRMPDRERERESEKSQAPPKQQQLFTSRPDVQYQESSVFLNSD
jgi:hypothetical protein